MRDDSQPRTCQNSKFVAFYIPCQMKQIVPELPESLARMSQDYRDVRSNQPSLTSEQMRAQLEKNRLNYAERPLTSNATQSSAGLKQAV